MTIPNKTINVTIILKRASDVKTIIFLMTDSDLILRIKKCWGRLIKVTENRIR